MQFQKSSRVLSDKELTDLLDDSMKKIASTAEQDSKKLSDMNNTLNWILTLTTVFFVFYTRVNISDEKLYGISLSGISKTFFLLLTSILILHKVFLVKYEDYKGAFLGSLKTHHIDLKFNLDKLSPKIIMTNPFSIVTFINSFRNGDFLFNSGREESVKGFRRLDKKISFCGKMLNHTYNMGMILFWFNLALMAYILIAIPIN